MNALGDIVMLLMHFRTLLIIFRLTYYLSAPSCQFLFSVAFIFQVFRPLKVPNKFQKNYIKNQRLGSFPKNQGRKGVDPPGPQEGPWRPPRARRPPF